MMERRWHLFRSPGWCSLRGSLCCLTIFAIMMFDDSCCTDNTTPGNSLSDIIKRLGAIRDQMGANSGASISFRDWIDKWKTVLIPLIIGKIVGVLLILCGCYILPRVRGSAVRVTDNSVSRPMVSLVMQQPPRNDQPVPTSSLCSAL